MIQIDFPAHLERPMVTEARGVRVRVDEAPRVAPTRRLTGQLRREIRQRFENTRQSYRSVRAFAIDEQQRLRDEDNVVITVAAIQGVIGRGADTLFKWEQVRDRLRQEWVDMGALAAGFQMTPAEVYVVLSRIRAKGYVIQKRPASRIAYRGWPLEYHIA